MSGLLGTRWNDDRPAIAEKKRKAKATQVFDGPAEQDHAAGLPDDHEESVATKSIADAIAAHNAHAPTAHRPGRELVGGPTSPDRAPVAPTGGTAAPGAPSLSDARSDCAVTPDSLSSPAEAARDGITRAQTRAPSGLDFTSSGAGVHAAARHPDGSFLAAGDVPVAKLDLQRQGAHDVGPVFSRPNEALPGHAMNGPSTAQPNTSTDERHGS